MEHIYIVLINNNIYFTYFSPPLNIEQRMVYIVQKLISDLTMHCFCSRKWFDFNNHASKKRNPIFINLNYNIYFFCNFLTFLHHWTTYGELAPFGKLTSQFRVILSPSMAVMWGASGFPDTARKKKWIMVLLQNEKKGPRRNQY